MFTMALSPHSICHILWIITSNLKEKQKYQDSSRKLFDQDDPLHPVTF